MRILIAEDDNSSRITIAKILGKLGHDVVKASNGEEAWEIFNRESLNLVITDWMMPQMDGFELCRRIRSANLSLYTYVIVMTTNVDEDALIKGMDAGADDFVVKPFSTNELNARLKAAERIIKLQNNLSEQNKQLTESNKELTNAYNVIKRDLEAGAKIQQSLLPKPSSIVYGIRFESIFLPSTFVAGDIFNYFKLDEDHVGFYVLDVAGHGIPAAMLSVTLSKALSPTNPQESLLKKFLPVPEPPYYRLINPAMAMRAMNERFQADDDIMQYFTMVYGLIDTNDGRTIISQAGHPPPIFLKNGASPTLIGSGGFPVGMLPEAEYEEEEVQLGKGDRLCVYSDGITECSNVKDEFFSEERLVSILEKGRHLPLEDLMKMVENELLKWKGNDEFEDDITFLAMEIV